MGNVMSGIAEALVATGVGLFVAIPAVVAYNIVQKKIGSIESNVVTIGKQITALLKSERKIGSGPTLLEEPSETTPIPDAPPSDAMLAGAE
jgi:biopolymer transport protein ExbB/biopolymer transport protein TolQ